MHRPARKFSCLDRAKQRRLGGFAVLSDHGFRFAIAVELMSLSGLEMEFDPVALALRVDEGIGMASVPVHVHRRDRQASIRHQDGDLVQTFRGQRPEIPHRRGRAHVGARVAFLRMDEVGKLIGVADEEHRGVVADQVPIAFVSIELQGKTAHIALGVGRAELAGNRRKPRQHVRLGARLQALRPGVFRDVVGDRQRTESAQAFGVHGALGNALAVLVRELLDELIILHEKRTTRASGDRVLVVRNRRPGSGGQGSTFAHWISPWSRTCGKVDVREPLRVAICRSAAPR